MRFLESMVGKSVEECTFCKTDQAMTLASRPPVKIKVETVTVDPHLLFQRMITVGDHSEDLPSLIKCDLCSHTPALLESFSLQTNNAVLTDILWKSMNKEQQEFSGNVLYVQGNHPSPTMTKRVHI